MAPCRPRRARGLSSKTDPRGAVKAGNERDWLKAGRWRGPRPHRCARSQPWLGRDSALKSETTPAEALLSY